MSQHDTLTLRKNKEKVSGFPLRSRLREELTSLRALAFPSPYIIVKPHARADQTFLPSEIIRFQHELVAAGKRVTGNALREMNGGRGNPKSLMKALLSSEPERFSPYKKACFTTAFRRAVPQSLRRANSQWSAEGETDFGERLRRGERTFHGFRVTGAVELALAGFNDAEIQAALGDRNPMMAWRYRKMAQKEKLLEGIKRLSDGWPAGLGRSEAEGLKDFLQDRMRFGFMSQDDLDGPHEGDPEAQ